MIPLPVLSAVFVVLFSAWLAVPPVHAAAATPRIEYGAEVRAFVQDMADRHGFERPALEKTLRDARFLSSIIRAMDAPATALPWHEFRTRHITDSRIRGGLQFWADNEAVIGRAAADYGVPAELIVATIGVETWYGRLTGNIGVLDALATLAFGYPRRADFFRGELEQFLLLAREEALPMRLIKGSYAGAIGIPQFMPSSYRKYAVDFDGDGLRDLRRVADAVGSVGNYYRQFGWRAGDTVSIVADIGENDPQPLLEAGILPHMTIAEFRKRGVIPMEPVAEEAMAALFRVQTAEGVQYRFGLNNFYVITRYNRSINYAMAVSELARALGQRRAEPVPAAAR